MSDMLKFLLPIFFILGFIFIPQVSANQYDVYTASLGYDAQYPVQQYSVPAYAAPKCGSGDNSAIWIVVSIVVIGFAIVGLIACIWCCINNSTCGTGRFGRWNAGACCPSYRKHRHGCKRDC